MVLFSDSDTGEFACWREKGQRSGQSIECVSTPTGSYTSWPVFLYPLSQPPLMEERDFPFNRRTKCIWYFKSSSHQGTISFTTTPYQKNCFVTGFVIMQLETSSLQTAYWGEKNNVVDHTEHIVYCTHIYTIYTYTIYTQRQRMEHTMRIPYLILRWVPDLVLPVLDI